MSEKTNGKGLDKLLEEFTNYKGLIIQITAFMVHSNNLYSDNVANPNIIHSLVDYSIKIVLLLLFFTSFIRIVLTKVEAIQSSWKNLDIKFAVKLLWVLISIIIIAFILTLIFQLL